MFLECFELVTHFCQVSIAMLKVKSLWTSNRHDKWCNFKSSTYARVPKVDKYCTGYISIVFSVIFLKLAQLGSNHTKVKYKSKRCCMNPLNLLLDVLGLVFYFQSNMNNHRNFALHNSNDYGTSNELNPCHGGGRQETVHN